MSKSIEVKIVPVRGASQITEDGISVFCETTLSQLVDADDSKVYLLQIFDSRNGAQYLAFSENAKEEYGMSDSDLFQKALDPNKFASVSVVEALANRVDTLATSLADTGIKSQVIKPFTVHLYGAETKIVEAEIPMNKIMPIQMISGVISVNLSDGGIVITAKSLGTEIIPITTTDGDEDQLVVMVHPEDERPTG